MYTIGLYILIDPDSFDLVVPEIQSMCHIEIVATEPDSGILMLSVSGDSDQQDKQIIDRIRSLSFVMEAEIIYFHYSSDEEAVSSPQANDNSTRTYRIYNYILHTHH